MELSKPKVIVPLVGFFTFFFGFAIGALINLYLIFIESPLVTTFRAALSFKSTIFGDGIILPVINMVAAYFLTVYRKFLNKFIIINSLIFGIIITSIFHILQATLGFVNWSMPEPWKWNLLGIFHAMYMFTITTFLSLFYRLSLKVFFKDELSPHSIHPISFGDCKKRGFEFLPKGNKKISWEIVIVTLGLTLFLILLYFDYFP